MIFFLITTSIMIVITLISLSLSKQYFPLRSYKKYRKRFFLFNLFIIMLTSLSHLNSISKENDKILFTVVAIWLALQLLLIIFSFIVMVIRNIFEKISSHRVDESKRNFLCGLIWLPAVSTALYGSLYESRHIQFTDFTIKVPDAPELDGIKAVQMSDVHLGNFFSVEKLEATLIQILKTSPDILLLTGDIFDDIETNDRAIAVFDKYAAQFPLGIYFCWGNHEYIRDIDHLREALSHSQVKLLFNDSVKIIDGVRPLYILGVDFLGGERDEAAAVEREQYVQSALAGVPENAYKILLAHHPIFIDNAFIHHIDLTLTGHTHGGQFAFLGIPLFPAFKYMMGMFKQDNYYGYVSRGAGSWFPCRVGCPPEITTFTFKS